MNLVHVGQVKNIKMLWKFIKKQKEKQDYYNNRSKIIIFFELIML